MTKPTTQEIALDCIKRLLTNRDELHAKDIIEAICIETGKNKKAHQITSLKHLIEISSFVA